MNAGVDVGQELIHFRFSGCFSSELEECFLRVHHRDERLEHGDLAFVLQGVQCREIVQGRLQHTNNDERSITYDRIIGHDTI